MLEQLHRWLGRPVHLVLGLVTLAVDIVTAASWITGAGGILKSWEVHLFLLIVFVPLTVLLLCAWVASHPARPKVRFAALHEEIVTCRDSIGVAAPAGDAAMMAMGQLADLAQKLRKLGVELQVRDFIDQDARAECLNDLLLLASLAAVGDLKEARARRQDRKSEP